MIGPNPLVPAKAAGDKHGGGGQAVRALARLAVSAWRWIEACRARARQRRALARLDDRLLADIGVSRREAAMEAARPFWTE